MARLLFIPVIDSFFHIDALFKQTDGSAIYHLFKLNSRQKSKNVIVFFWGYSDDDIVSVCVCVS